MYGKWIAAIVFGIVSLSSGAASSMHFMAWDAQTYIPVSTKMIKQWALHFCHLKEPVWLNLSKPDESILFDDKMVRARLVLGKSVYFIDSDGVVMKGGKVEGVMTWKHFQTLILTCRELNND